MIYTLLSFSPKAKWGLLILSFRYHFLFWAPFAGLSPAWLPMCLRPATPAVPPEHTCPPRALLHPQPGANKNARNPNSNCNPRTLYSDPAGAKMPFFVVFSNVKVQKCFSLCQSVQPPAPGPMEASGSLGSAGREGKGGLGDRGHISSEQSHP